MVSGVEAKKLRENLTFFSKLTGKQKQQLEDLGDMLCAKIALADMSDQVVSVLYEEWIGLNKLERDDEI